MPLQAAGTSAVGRTLTVLALLRLAGHAGLPAETAGQGADQEPATAADAPQGRLGRAAEAASELAASAVGRVKHATAVATGTPLHGL